MRRGDVYWVDFEPARGGEIRKTRPAIIVSNDNANYRLNRLQVVPLTSSITRVYPSDAIVSINGNPSKSVANQIRTVTKERLGNRIGSISTRDMFAVERALRIQLGLN